MFGFKEIAYQIDRYIALAVRVDYSSLFCLPREVGESVKK